MAEWKGTKTDWTPEDGINDENFNRIEGNIQYNHDEIAGLLMQGVRWKSGRFKGYVVDDQFISVGFTPDIVMIVGNRHPRYDNAYGFTRDFDSEDDKSGPVILITKNHPAEVIADSRIYTVAKIATNGFRISRGAVFNGRKFQWVALKIGQ